MKRALLGLSMLFVSSLHAANSDINVSLAANPSSGITKGSAVTLTATVSEKKPFPQPKYLNLKNLRYTFTAQRTWPCSDAVQEIAQNSSNATVSWTPSKAGVYTFRVAVTHFEKLPSPVRVPPLAESALNNYRVTPPAGFGHNVGFSYSPSSGAATAPASITVTLNVSNPGSHRYPFKVYLGGTCSGELPTQSSCTIANVAANSYLPQAEVSEIDGCEWTGYIGTHDYTYYVVNR